MTRRIYVIMPVASDPEHQSKRSVVESVAIAFGLATLFPLDAGTEFNLDVTLTELRESDIIIADLSNERPSCYYELGLVHALHKPVFVFATAGTTIHQLSDRKSVAYYDGLEALRDLLTNAIASTKLANPEMHGSCG